MGGMFSSFLAMSLNPMATLAIVNWLTEPLQYGFMQRSLMVAVMVGVICAVVGSYLMVQRLALLGDAISHSLLPGLAMSFRQRLLAGPWPFYWESIFLLGPLWPGSSARC